MVYNLFDIDMPFELVGVRYFAQHHERHAESYRCRVYAGVLIFAELTLRAQDSRSDKREHFAERPNDSPAAIDNRN